MNNEKKFNIFTSKFKIKGLSKREIDILASWYSNGMKRYKFKKYDKIGKLVTGCKRYEAGTKKDFIAKNRGKIIFENLVKELDSFDSKLKIQKIIPTETENEFSFYCRNKKGELLKITFECGGYIDMSPSITIEKNNIQYIAYIGLNRNFIFEKVTLEYPRNSQNKTLRKR